MLKTSGINRLAVSLILCTVLLLLVIIFQGQYFRFKGNKTLTDEQKAELRQLGGEALKNLDVPVGAILVYREKIIGRGFNTVRLDGNIAGHAEINAINDAVSWVGLEEFQKLDRSDLVLISTYEPCEMCQGTLDHYNIRQTFFLKDKSLNERLKSFRSSFLNNLNKRQSDGEELQDSLFLLHPDYPGHKH